MDMQPKSIIENFDDYGRMNALLGTELPFTNILNQTSMPFKYIDPPTEVITPGDTQIWKITHNGVDTHSIHTHLIELAGNQPGGLGRGHNPAQPQRVGLEGNRADEPPGRYHRGRQVQTAGDAPDPVLPFAVNHSNRLLDPTNPPGGTGWQFTAGRSYHRQPGGPTHDKR